nr:ATPase [Microbacterium sediminis]
MLHVPTWPVISARIDADGSGVLTMNGTEHPIDTTSAENARREVVRFCADTAQKLQRPVRVTVEEPDSTWPLIVHPDGKVDAVDETDDADFPDDDTNEATPVIEAVPGMTAPADDAEPAGPRRTSHVPVVADDASAEAPAATPEDIEPIRTPAADPAPEPAAAPTPMPMPLPTQTPPVAMPAARQISPQSRRSFIAPERLEEPATRGFRGALSRMGVKVSPGAAERAEREDQAAVSQHFPGPRTIAVVNGKGGANKTPTTILTSAVFARYGGAGVLAWDNNQTRGTLGWRTEQGPHDATLHDLLPETERLLSTNAQSSELARYVHHQTRDKYDVLRSQPMVLASQQRVSSDDVDRIHAVAAKYYRIIVMDSGNDESDPMWLRMIDHTDQLVVATSSRAEHAEAGALLLEALAERDERSAALASNAVTVVSQSDEKATAAEIRRIEDGYRDLVREVVRIPYDPAMGAAQLHYRALRPETQRAWLAATAAIARGLAK